MATSNAPPPPAEEANHRSCAKYPSRRPGKRGASLFPALVSPLDWTCLGYLAVTSVLVAALWGRLPAPWLHGVARVAWVAAIALIVRTCRDRGGWRGFLRIAYPMALIPMCYTEVPHLIDAWGRRPLDAEMVAIDDWLFGVQPCIWLHPARTAWLTDVLMVIYVSFLPLPVFAWAAMRMRYNDRRLHFFSFVIAFGFLSSYLGYLAFPVRGPCHHLLEISPLPEAGPIGHALQAFLTASTRGARGVYDGFPSGHTIVSILMAWAAWRVDRRLATILIPLAALIILSTMYLQYHYAIDLLVGAVWALASMPVILWAWRRWAGRSGSGQWARVTAE